MRTIWLLAGLVAGTPMLANAETFDTSFSGDGKVLLTTTLTDYRVVTALSMPNGDVVQVAERSGGDCNSICYSAIRYSASGDIIYTYNYPYVLHSIDGAAVDGSGRVVIVGSTVGNGPSGRDFVVLRLLGDLTEDYTFGSGGAIYSDFFGSTDEARAVAIDAQDNIVVVGMTTVGANDSDFAILRLRSDGSTDTSFGGDGQVAVPFDLGASSPVDVANAVSIASNGSILLGGNAYDSAIGRSRVAMARLTPNGAYDATFCAGGCAVNPGYSAIKDGRTIYYFGENTAHDDGLEDMDTFANGAFAIVGFTLLDNGTFRGAIARFNSDGEYAGESVQGGLVNSQYRSVRSADAAGSRFIVAGASGSGSYGPVSFSLRAFGGTMQPLANYGNGNCETANSGFCFTASGQLADRGPDYAGVLTLDSSGRPLFSGSAIANAEDTTTTLITARFTNSTGPKPDRIFRSGFN